MKLTCERHGKSDCQFCRLFCTTEYWRLRDQWDDLTPSILKPPFFMGLAKDIDITGEEHKIFEVYVKGYSRRPITVQGGLLSCREEFKPGELFSPKGVVTYNSEERPLFYQKLPQVNISPEDTLRITYSINLLKNSQCRLY